MEWRKIPGFGRYSVSDTGLVRRDIRMHKTPAGSVSLSKSHFGYMKCSLTSDSGEYKTLLVHTLVATAFLGPRPDGLVVCHNDGNPQNNTISNLRYDTHTGNVSDAIRHGTQARGCRQHLAKLDDATVAEARLRFVEGGITVKALAKEYGISNSSMWSALTGKTWAHVSPFVKPTGKLLRTRSGRMEREWAAA